MTGQVADDRRTLSRHRFGQRSGGDGDEIDAPAMNGLFSLTRTVWAQIQKRRRNGRLSDLETDGFQEASVMNFTASPND